MNDFERARKQRNERAPITFDSVEQQRAWALTVEQCYKITNVMSSTAAGMHNVKKAADEGSALAQAIMQKFIELRMKG